MNSTNNAGNMPLPQSNPVDAEILPSTFPLASIGHMIARTCNGADCQYICKTTLKTHSGRIVSALGEADTLQAASDTSRTNATRLLQTQLAASNDAATQSHWDDAPSHSQGPQDRPQDKAMASRSATGLSGVGSLAGRMRDSQACPSPSIYT